ncbi:universal stress protein [Parapusillimonas sp. SGNA-6]|nr:universal stress protein [Parapusillimonas sp. SGNA-6]
MYKKIMVALDGSAVSMRAFEQALGLAKDERAALQAVYIVEYPNIYIADVGYDPVAVMEPLVQEGQRILDKAEALMKARGLAASSRLIDNGPAFGPIAEQLQAAADECQADLVVLGAHGRSGFKRLLLGSVAEAFVRLSRRPTLLVPGKSGNAS